MKKVVYISGGNAKGNARALEQFAVSVAAVRDAGFVVINTAPTVGDDMLLRLRGLGQLAAADVVYFAPGWNRSVIGQFEMSYCKYTGKPYATKLDELPGVLV